MGSNILDVWDFEKNVNSPYEISKKSNKDLYIRCINKEYHGSYKIKASKFTIGQRCPMCSRNSGKVHPLDSFAQYHIDNTDPNFLEKYWDWDKNNELGIDPWKISPKTHKKIYITCQEKEYHGGYLVSCANFSKGQRCGYCKMKIQHPLDSFGYYNFDKVMSWHPDNEISPFSVSCGSDYRAKFICNICGEEFETRVANVSIRGGWCPHCTISKGEKTIKSLLDRCKIDYTHDQPYFKDLVGLGGGLLRPDFILEKEKIWIEYDGEFHYKNMTGNLKTQQYHDRLKNEYAEKNGWKMIRIPYWEFDKIEEILDAIIFRR